MWLKETLKKEQGKIIFLKEQDEISMAKELFKISESYKKIILHIHPDDIIPILAFSNSKIINKIYFFNHADHVFWLGVTINCCVLELTESGKQISLLKRGIINSEVLSIPISAEHEKIVESKINLKQKIESFKIDTKEKNIFSMASSYKFEKILDYDFFEFLNKLQNFLNMRQINFIIAGPDLKNKKWKKIYLTSNKRIIPIGFLSKEEVLEIWNMIDLYIDSFPINSYTCVLEAISNNVYSYSLKTVLPTLDALEDAKVSSIDELYQKVVDYFEKMPSHDKMIKCQKIRNEVQKRHFKEFWLKKLHSIFKKYENNNVEKNYIFFNDNFNDEYEKFLEEMHKKSLYKYLKKIRKISFKYVIIVFLYVFVFNVIKRNKK